MIGNCVHMRGKCVKFGEIRYGESIEVVVQKVGFSKIENGSRKDRVRVESPGAKFESEGCEGRGTGRCID